MLAQDLGVQLLYTHGFLAWTHADIFASSSRPSLADMARVLDDPGEKVQIFLHDLTGLDLRFSRPISRITPTAMGIGQPWPPET